MDIKNKTEDITEHIGDLVDTYYRLTILRAADKATGIAANALASVVVTLLSIFVLIFAGVGLAIWLGRVVDNMAAGFFIVAGFFALVMTIIVLVRKKIVFPFIRNSIIKKAYE